MVFVPPSAPFAVLGFLGAAFLIAAGLAVALFGILGKQRRLAIGGVSVSAAAALCYLIVWSGAALMNPERLLPVGALKYFCEIDCHLACSVEGVERAEVLGSGDLIRRTTSTHEFVIVTLRSWFDPETISAKRGTERPLYPNPRVVVAEDAGGRRYAPVADGPALLAAMGRSSTPLRAPIRPGESYRTLLVFETPRGARGLRLYVGNVPVESAFLVGHEAAPIARKAWFRLEGAGPPR